MKISSVIRERHRMNNDRVFSNNDGTGAYQLVLNSRQLLADDLLGVCIGSLNVARSEAKTPEYEEKGVHSDSDFSRACPSCRDLNLKKSNLIHCYYYH